MAIPELVLKSAERLLTRYCAGRIPPCPRNQVRVSFQVRDEAITLTEERPDLASPGRWLGVPVAQFRFHAELLQWTLHYPDHARRWIFYPNVPPTLDLGRLLRHLDADPLHLFWG